MSGGTPGVADLSRSCRELPADGPCNPSYTWNTGATFGNGTAKYPPGTYTVQVILKLNNILNNYLNAGARYMREKPPRRKSPSPLRREIQPPSAGPADPFGG